MVGRRRYRDGWRDRPRCIQGCSKKCARLRELTPSIVASSRNLAVTFLDIPVHVYSFVWDVGFPLHNINMGSPP